jgi:hypothetical protein
MAMIVGFTLTPKDPLFALILCFNPHSSSEDWTSGLCSLDESVNSDSFPRSLSSPSLELELSESEDEDDEEEELFEDDEEEEEDDEDDDDEEDDELLEEEEESSVKWDSLPKSLSSLSLEEELDDDDEDESLELLELDDELEEEEDELELLDEESVLSDSAPRDAPMVAFSSSQAHSVGVGTVPEVSLAQKEWTYSFPQSFRLMEGDMAFKHTVWHPMMTAWEPWGHFGSHLGSHANEQKEFIGHAMQNPTSPEWHFGDLAWTMACILVV